MKTQRKKELGLAILRKLLRFDFLISSPLTTARKNTEVWKSIQMTKEDGTDTTKVDVVDGGGT